MESEVLIDHLNKLLNISSYTDYGPNGLQIEGKKSVQKIAFAVSATKESIQKAVDLQADMLIVHHGLFWKFHGTRTITKAFYHRIAPLIKNDINLVGYHLPLDGHPEIGNAASIAQMLNLEACTSFGEYKGMPTGIKGHFNPPISPLDLKNKLKNILNHPVIHSDSGKAPISSIGIITGGANSNWIECLKDNLDAYLTGEISEHDWHEAKESEIHFFAGGHNATEQFGIQNLMKYIEKNFGDYNLKLHFINSNNPA